MAEANEVIERPNSCEISINAKGEYSGKVKVYADTIDSAVVLAEVNAEYLAKLIAKKNGH